MDFIFHYEGANDDLDEDNSGEVDDNVFLLTDDVEDGGFHHAPRPALLQKGLPHDSCVCVIFTTVWDRVRVQGGRIF